VTRIAQMLCIVAPYIICSYTAEWKCWDTCGHTWIVSHAEPQNWPEPKIKLAPRELPEPKP
jgi:hypothetical protein